MSSFESIEKANVQKFVDMLSARHQRLDFDEGELEKKLIGFTIFMAKRDEDPSKYKAPYQFRLENHAEFKGFSIPISRAMWASLKVVMKMRTQLYEYETDRSTILPETQIPQPITINPAFPAHVPRSKATCIIPTKRIQIRA